MKRFIVFLFVLFSYTSGQACEEPEMQQDTLKPGMKSPDFRYRDVNGKVVSLKDFRKKYVYIDLWATWCGPCCGELPFLKELEKKFHGRNIAFVSISCDENRRMWQNFVKKNKLEGVQLNNEGNQKFFEAYGVEGIPRFILLDKKGKIINPDMTRPSDPKTLEILSNLKGI